jgi:hypothetical protein
MVRKDEVDSTAMQVERFAEVFHRHGGALEMPSGTAPSPGRIPRGRGLLILGLRRLPQREVLRVLLRVVVLRDTRAAPDLASIQA